MGRGSARARRDAAFALVLVLAVVAWGCAPAGGPSAAQGLPAKAVVSSAEPVASALSRLNELRAELKLPPVVEDRALSRGDLAHARYLVANHLETPEMIVAGERIDILAPDDVLHRETPGSPLYSAEGASAVQANSIVIERDPALDGAHIIDLLLTLPFGALLALDPQLSAIGFGEDCVGRRCLGVLSVRRGLDKDTWVRLYSGNAGLMWNPALGPVAFGPASLKSPIGFPADRSEIDYKSSPGAQWLDLGGACGGYNPPTGPPILLELGQGSGPQGTVAVTDAQFSESGTLLDSCVFGPSDFASPNEIEQQIGRNMMGLYGAVFLIPRAPLEPGHSYTVSIAADGQKYEWSFKVAANVQPSTIAHGPAPGREWLAQANRYRATVGLEPLEEDSAWSDWDRKHTRYLVEKYGRELESGGSLGAEAHREDAGSPWYTVEGETAARSSVIYFAHGAGQTPQKLEAAAVDSWLMIPFHRLPILDPDLKRAGFGSYAKYDAEAAAMLTVIPPRRQGLFSKPIAFPPQGAVISTRSFDSHEWPDPLASCQGYRPPAGMPITLQIGAGIDAPISSHSITSGGKPVEHCAFSNTSYTNPDAFTQRQAREALKRYGAIVLVPRKPLATGAVYTVSVTVRGRKYRWSFKAGTGPSKVTRHESVSRVCAGDPSGGNIYYQIRRA